MAMVGSIFDIQRFAVHDGPGIRTTVFFKGCSNRCGWCHNPESLQTMPQLQYFPHRCVGCGACAAVCPQHAHILGEAHVLDRLRCVECGACAKVCNAQALVMIGRTYTLEEVLETALADEAYYKTSGGGVTLSGGEPVLQRDFAAALLRRLKELGIHTCLETAGNYPYSLLEPLAPYLDLVLFDLKAWSEEVYRVHIGGDKTRILDTLLHLDDTGVPIIVRTPVVGSVNDCAEEIEAIARFAGGLKHLRHYQLIPYHALGKSKYDALGQAYEVPYFTPTEDDMRRLEQAAAQYAPVFNPKRGYVSPESRA